MRLSQYTTQQLREELRARHRREFPLSVKARKEVQTRVYTEGFFDLVMLRRMEETFWPYVDFQDYDVTRCWIWNGYVAPGPNGKHGSWRVRIDGKRRRYAVHRLVYALWNGPIPDTHLVHHTCETKGCVNPTHLELKTWAKHTQDHNSREECELSNMCRRGLHEFTPENTKYVDGRRTCRQCGKDRRRLRVLQRRGTYGS